MPTHEFHNSLFQKMSNERLIFDEIMYRNNKSK
jgi:hypothetical protein